MELVNDVDSFKLISDKPNKKNNKNNTYSVYKHTNKINGKVYIGMTINEPEVRWGRNGEGYSKQLFGRAIHKYGWDNFEHEILFTNLSRKEADAKEIELIKKYNATDRNSGYNISPGGSKAGFSHQSKVVYQYSLSGEFLKQYPSLSDAAKRNHVNHAVIGACCRKGINHSSKNYRWSYEYLGEQVAWELMRNHNFYQEVYCYDLNGRFLKRYDTVTDAQNDTGIDNSNICGCYSGKTTNTKGYRWFTTFQGEQIQPLEYVVSSSGQIRKPHKDYKMERKKVYQYDANGNYIKTFSCAREIQEQYGYGFRLISHGCLHKAKHYGFYWSYKMYSNLFKEK